MQRKILILTTILFLRIFIAPAWLSAATTGNCGLDDDTLFHLVTLHKRRSSCEGHSETSEFAVLNDAVAIQHIPVQIKIKNFISVILSKFFSIQSSFPDNSDLADAVVKKYLLLGVLRI